MRAHAAGLCAAEAAAELLIGHGRWLGRDDFVDEYVTVQAHPALAGDVPMAVVQWPAAVAASSAGRLPCSGSERRVLGIAASLAGEATVALGEALTGLDEANLALVAAAVRHAGGRRPAGAPVAGPPGPCAAVSGGTGGSSPRDVAGTMSCPVCGRGFTRRGRRTYYSSRCRRTAFRRRRSAGAAVPPVPAARSRREGTVYRCGQCDTGYLGHQWCPECNRSCARVGPGGCCPGCQEPVALDELVSPCPAADGPAGSPAAGHRRRPRVGAWRPDRPR